MGGWVDIEDYRQVIQEIRNSLFEVEEWIAQGKGEWPKPGYIRDHVWDGWIGRQLALTALLRQVDPGYLDEQWKKNLRSIPLE